MARSQYKVYLKKDATIAALKKVLPDLRIAVGKASQAGANDFKVGVTSVAPVKTGRYRSSYDVLFIPDRSAEMGVPVWGVYAKFIWKFLEYGTTKMPAQPHVWPIYRILKKNIKSRFTREIRAQVKGLQ